MNNSIKFFYNISDRQSQKLLTYERASVYNRLCYLGEFFANEIIHFGEAKKKLSDELTAEVISIFTCRYAKLYHDLLLLYYLIIQDKKKSKKSKTNDLRSLEKLKGMFKKLCECYLIYLNQLELSDEILLRAFTNGIRRSGFQFLAKEFEKKDDIVKQVIKWTHLWSIPNSHAKKYTWQEYQANLEE